MDEQKTLHLNRVKQGLNKIAEIRSRKLHPKDDEFEGWHDRTWQSLGELFGKSHDYALSFRRLNFWDMRMVSDYPGVSGGGWSRGDQQIWEGDLRKAEQLLKDAIEEFYVAPPMSPLAAKVPFVKATPQFVINITNTLSQTASVQLNQVLGAIQDLELSLDEKRLAETEAKRLDEETHGEQRWPILSKSLDVLKGLGRPAYERVALPLLFEMLKKQMGA